MDESERKDCHEKWKRYDTVTLLRMRYHTGIRLRSGRSVCPDYAHGCIGVINRILSERGE